MQINKKPILIILGFFILTVLTFFVILFIPVQKEELNGKYLEILSGGFWGIINPTPCCTYRTIDDKNFCTFPNMPRSLEYSHAYTLKSNILTYYDPGAEDSIVKYKVIKIVNHVILLGGDYNRILVKTNRKIETSPGSKQN